MKATNEFGGGGTEVYSWHVGVNGYSLSAGTTVLRHLANALTRIPYISIRLSSMRVNVSVSTTPTLQHLATKKGMIIAPCMLSLKR